MLQKPLEYWLVLVGIALWAIQRDLKVVAASAEAKQQPISLVALITSAISIITKTTVSMLLAVGISPSLADKLGITELWAMAVVMALGQILLEAIVAIIADREFIKQLILRKIGGGSDV